MESYIGAGGPHDLGGTLNFSSVDTCDHSLQYWEQSIHAVLVLLASHSPQLITTDENRRAVESLEPSAHDSWTYYDKWAAAITIVLLERGVITQLELDAELGPNADVRGSEVTFNIGDEIRIKTEDSRVRWRKPHLRCPGYLFGAVGKIVGCVGTFADPYHLAYRGKSSMTTLFRVKFKMSEIWGSRCEDSNDYIDVEVYESWLEKICMDSVADNGMNQIRGSEGDFFPEHADHLHDHDHGHSHETHECTESHKDPGSHRRITHPASEEFSHAKLVGHTHDHEHLDRLIVEEEAVRKEPEDSPGRVIADVLIRLLISKGIITHEDIRRTIDRFDNAKQNLFGAHLVARAWVDPDFKARLLSDGKNW